MLLINDQETQVAEEDVIGTMMTDKAAVELSSPVSGRVVSLAGVPGDVIAVGAPLVVFETDASVAVDEAAEEDSGMKTPPAQEPEETGPEAEAPVAKAAAPARRTPWACRSTLATCCR